MKPRNAKRAKASAVMLTMLLTEGVSGCESEVDRKDEAIREDLRNAIPVIEKAQRNHLAVQREFVELHDRLKLKAFAWGKSSPGLAEREKLERSEKECESGRQDDMREQIDNASGEELQRIFLKVRLIGEKADLGKTFTASAQDSL